MYYLLNQIIVEKRILGIDDTDNKFNIPDYLNFLVIVDSTFPDNAPKILSKTNV
jgi:hypothetical protein